jgi:GDP-mannose 6-dehydrogenase
MKISIFGMGYVGVVSGACLARLGHQVVGVDVAAQKVDMINAGGCPIVEEGIADLMADVVASGALRATADVDEAVENSDISFVSVGTPSAPNGALSTQYLERVSEQIGQAIKRKPGAHAIVYRSTMLPGTTDDLLTPILTVKSGRILGDGLEVGFNPEFLREGSSIKDFHAPPMTVIGAASDSLRTLMAEIYAGVAAPVFNTEIRAAESVKYMSNIYHAVKISFANEMGTLLHDIGIDAREVAEIFCQDTVLNVSKAYLRPGYAFGGSCLPKDLRAVLSMAKRRDLELPMLASVLPSNQRHIERAFDLVTSHGTREVALFGLSFKSGTDDLRESPLVTLAERLIGKGYNLRIYDPNVQAARLVGANKQYIEREIPHLEELLRLDPEATLDGAGVVVVGHADPDAVDAILNQPTPRPIVDLQGIQALQDRFDGNYQGICW